LMVGTVASPAVAGDTGGSARSGGSKGRGRGSSRLPVMMRESRLGPATPVRVAAGLR
jgi:hypothetical protein